MNIPPRYRRILRYVAVGFAAYLLEMGVLVLFTKGFGWSDIVSVGISFWVGFFASFGLQKIIAFENHERRPKRVLWQLVLFGVLVAWNYVFTLAAVELLHDKFNVVVIRSLCMAIIICWNYVLYSKLIFTQHEKASDTDQ